MIGWYPWPHTHSDATKWLLHTRGHTHKRTPDGNCTCNSFSGKFFLFYRLFEWRRGLNLMIWPSEGDWQHVHILCRYPERSVMKKAFLLTSSAKDVMARSPRVTCPLIAIRKRLEALISSLPVCVPVRGGQQWPYAVVCCKEMSRCVRRRLEAGGNSKEGEGGKDLPHHITVFWGIVARAVKHKRL